jgi:hypothetical protein
VALDKGSPGNASNLLIFALSGLADYSHSGDNKTRLEAAPQAHEGLWPGAIGHQNAHIRAGAPQDDCGFVIQIRQQRLALWHFDAHQTSVF